MSGLTSWWRRRWNATARDVIGAVAMTAVTVGGSYGEAHPNHPYDMVVNGHHVPNTPNAALLLVALASVALAWRRRYPVTVLVVSVAAATTYSLLGYVNGAAMLAPMFALYAVTRTVNVRQAVAAAVIALVVLMGATATGNPFGPTGGGFLLIPAMVAAALFGGIAVANRRAYIASMKQRAEDEARRQVDEERLRIARELHDVVAHTMSTINVQASAAAMVLTERPDAAAEALQAIRTASKNGLRELRAILNVLRQADDADPTAPTPGLAQLSALIDGAIRAGLPTTLDISGDPAALPATVDLAAYRIIQESLTNAIRHAGPATAIVALTYLDGKLAIEVTDSGRGGLAAPAASERHDGAGPASQGHGLVGMRERATAAGGVLRAGRRSDGGFSVTATLPFSLLEEPDGQDGADNPASHRAPGGPARPPAHDGPSQPVPAPLAAAEEGGRQ